MIRLTENQSTLNTVGLCFLGMCLWLGIGNAAQADSADYGMPVGAQAMSPIANAATSNTPVVVCGGQSGQRSVVIRGADIATMWRSAYHMLFPSLALADKNKMDRGKALPDKGPTWRIGIAHGNALLTVQTKW